MFWAGIVGTELIGPFQVEEGVKLAGPTYCDLLDKSLFTWWDKQSPNKQKKLIFQQDNAPSHTAKYTMAYLKTKGLKESQIMTWPPNSPDLNPIENLWGIIKEEVYRSGKQYDSKDDLWKAIVHASKSVTPDLIQKLTAGVDKRVMDVISKDGDYINK